MIITIIFSSTVFLLLSDKKYRQYSLQMQKYWRAIFEMTPATGNCFDYMFHYFQSRSVFCSCPFKWCSKNSCTHLCAYGHFQSHCDCIFVNACACVCVDMNCKWLQHYNDTSKAVQRSATKWFAFSMQIAAAVATTHSCACINVYTLNTCMYFNCH